MDPIIIVPVALAVAWAATRKKKTVSKPKATSTVQPEPVLPSVDDDLPGPFEGPGGEEPWRPGGPTLPKPPQDDGPVGPKPFPGPSAGPKPPEVGDPRPIEIYPGTTPEDLEEHVHADYGLFISSDCETVLQGERWWDDVFLPQARELVLGNPEMFHHPTAVIHELLVNLGGVHEEEVTPAQECAAAWVEFVYGEFTPYGTYSGWIGAGDEYYEYHEWFEQEYPELSRLLWDLYVDLWAEPDLGKVFDREWPGDLPDEDGLDFEPTGT